MKTNAEIEYLRKLEARVRFYADAGSSVARLILREVNEKRGDNTMTYLTKIHFTKGLEGNGWQETPTAKSRTLLHLYDEDGEQLDSGNGYFPSAEWEAIGEPQPMADSDDFWQIIGEAK